MATRFETAVIKFFRTTEAWLNEYIGPLTAEGRERIRKTYEAVHTKPDPKGIEALLGDTLSDIFTQLSDPKTSAITAYTMRTALLLSVLPFSLGSAAGILAEKKVLIPMRKAVRPNVLDKEENIEALFRQLKDGKVTRDGLQALGYEDADIETLLKLAEFVPSAQDVIRFAVREVYNPATVARFGQLEGFEDIWKLAEKDVTAARMTKDAYSKYWAAHWELPSINQAYEMLHRGYIKPDDLDKLLVAADVMPFWRDKIKAVSYNTFTRVDIRRMHKLGVLDEAGVLKAHKDIGYNEEDAKRLTQFTLLTNADPEAGEESASDRQRKANKDLTKGEILNAYADKLLSQVDTATELFYLGYSEQEAAQLIAMADYKSAVSDLKNSLKYYKDGYMSGAYSEPEVYGMLGKLGLPAAYTENAFSQWKLEKSAKVETPTKAEFLTWWKAYTITAGDCKEGLANLGYKPKHIAWYMTTKPAKDG